MDTKKLEKLVRNIPDFPIKGIQFKDVTTLFKEADALQELSDGLYEMYKGKGITKVVGIESRGFILGPMIAHRLHAGFVPVRKFGKLPAPTFSESFSKEYGDDAVYIHQDALSANDVVLLHDDLLATGGTMLASVNLVKRFNLKKVYVNFLIELEDLKGRALFDPSIEITSLLKYNI
ncbi:adenine phosphoribosyltransferase [Bacteroidia bacterium]|nr:adenine phosphoribosyltransferase [Bacteroidia bacterium]